MRVAVACLFFAAGCGGGETTPALECTPACAPGSHCTDGGCASDEVRDLAMAIPDLAGCHPACSGATPFCLGNRCVPCLDDKDCPVGNVCKTMGGTMACVPGCADDARCGMAPAKCCGGACTDTGSDLAHCGACGMACAAVAHARSSCKAGACGFTCDDGFDDCDHKPDTGCEANLKTDTAHCSACGMACMLANAIQGCDNSGCFVAGCQFGFEDCNADPRDGCETPVTADVKNCGGCGMMCAGLPHAKVACINASCQVASCDAGFADCDGKSINGCEITLATDRLHCGMCGTVCGQGLVCQNGACTCQQCNFPNAKSRCVNLMCVLDSCLPGYSSCNNLPQDGCEVNTAGDARNCGGCGVVCPMNMPVCVNGACMGMLPGSKLWLRADMLGLNEGALVPLWPDTSGNGNDAVQASQNRQPVFHLNVLNGLPVVAFDGADDVLGFRSVTQMQSFSFFIVYRFTAGAPGPSVYYPVVFGGDQNVTGQYSGIETLNAAGGNSPSVLDIFAGFANDARATLQDISAYAQWKVISSVTAGMSHAVTVNCNGASAMMSTTGQNVAMNVQIGNANGTGWGGVGGVPFMNFGSYAAKVEVAELILFTSALSQQDRQIVENYLNARYRVY